MISVFVILSDIPQYIAQILSVITGSDTTWLTKGFSELMSSFFEAIDKIVA